MVKKLYVYEGTYQRFAYRGFNGEVENSFKGRISVEKDSNGNIKYFLNSEEGKQRIYSKGNRRITIEDGVFVIGEDRNWGKLVSDILN